MVHLGQVDYAETAEIVESAESLLSLPNQIFTSYYNLWNVSGAMKQKIAHNYQLL